MKPYYEHAGITIFHGDCREILPTLPKCDLLLTDPPYGIGEASGKNKTRSNLAVARDYGTHDWDNAPPSAELIMAARSICDRSIIFGGNYFELPPSKCWLVWDKVNGSNDFADCEMAWTNLDKAVRMFRYMWNGMLREGDDVRVHPTQKPLALMKWCISHVPSAKTILDPFCGSGTTLVAVKDMGLTGIGIEREEAYCEIAAKRLSQEVFDFNETTP